MSCVVFFTSNHPPLKLMDYQEENGEITFSANIAIQMHCWKLFPQSHGKNGGMFTYQIINLCWMGKFQGVFGKSSDDLCQVQFNEIPVGVTDIFFVLSSHSLPTLLVAKKSEGSRGT